MVIFDTFINNYFPALWGIAGMPIGNPVQVTLAFSNAVAIALVIMRGAGHSCSRYCQHSFFPTHGVIRNPSGETDYQAFVYIVTSMFNGLFSLWVAKEMLDEEKLTYSKKAALSVLYITLLLYWIATPIYFYEDGAKVFPLSTWGLHR